MITHKGWIEKPQLVAQKLVDFYHFCCFFSSLLYMRSGVKLAWYPKCHSVGKVKRACFFKKKSWLVLLFMTTHKLLQWLTDHRSFTADRNPEEKEQRIGFPMALTKWLSAASHSSFLVLFSKALHFAQLDGKTGEWQPVSGNYKVATSNFSLLNSDKLWLERLAPCTETGCNDWRRGLNIQ